MTHDPAGAPPIDTALAHYMERQALAIALDKATPPDQRVKVAHLIGVRLVLMQCRDVFNTEAVAKRHARGEIYSRARVAAINAMDPTQSDLDSNVKSSYLRQPDSEGVLKAHARSHFVYGLVSARLMLALHTPDVSRDASSRLAVGRCWRQCVGQSIEQAERTGAGAWRGAAIVAVLTGMRDALLRLDEQGGRAYFEVDR